MTDPNERIEEHLRKIKEAGKLLVGEDLKPTSYGGEKQSREEIEAEYKAEQRHREKRHKWWVGEDTSNNHLKTVSTWICECGAIVESQYTKCLFCGKMRKER